MIIKSNIDKRIFSGGFIATTALIILFLGAYAYVLVVINAVVWYSDSVDAREIRIQRRLNEKSCQDTRQILIIKDYFWNSPVYLPDFDCTITK